VKSRKFEGICAFSCISAARNKETGSKVAIKKICPMSASDIDAKHTLREIRLMRYLGRHENVVELVICGCCTLPEPEGIVVFTVPGCRWSH
jgi:serine/threonine protein kinase